MGVELKKIQYGPFENCLELTNGIVRLVITTDFGPRVMFYGFVDGENAFHNFQEQMDNFSKEEWQSYGGHRLWIAPEVFPRTYYCDIDPVKYTFEDNILTLECLPEKGTGMQKTIEISLDEDSSRVAISHTVTNTNCWDTEYSVWALSVMAAGTRAFIPQEDYVPHGKEEGHTFLPARNLILWPFTSMKDSRLNWEDRYICISEDSDMNPPVKIGVGNTLGVVVADGPGGIFIKSHDYYPEAVYPDMGCNEEFFTIAGFLEIETLAPLTKVKPGDAVEHVEFWRLEKGSLPETPEKIDAEIRKYIKEEMEYNEELERAALLEEYPEMSSILDDLTD